MQCTAGNDGSAEAGPYALSARNSWGRRDTFTSFSIVHSRLRRSSNTQYPFWPVSRSRCSDHTEASAASATTFAWPMSSMSAQLRTIIPSGAQGASVPANQCAQTESLRHCLSVVARCAVTRIRRAPVLHRSPEGACSSGLPLTARILLRTRCDGNPNQPVGSCTSNASSAWTKGWS